MDEKELKQIEQILVTVVSENSERISAVFDSKLERFKGEIITEFSHLMGIQREDFQHSLDLVVEGHQMLNDKLERTRVELKEDFQGIEQCASRIEVKIDSVATDLAAHRADTEAHHGVYLVRESGE